MGGEGGATADFGAVKDKIVGDGPGGAKVVDVVGVRRSEGVVQRLQPPLPLVPAHPPSRDRGSAETMTTR